MSTTRVVVKDNPDRSLLFKTFGFGVAQSTKSLFGQAKEPDPEDDPYFSPDPSTGSRRGSKSRKPEFSPSHVVEAANFDAEHMVFGNSVLPGKGDTITNIELRNVPGYRDELPPPPGAIPIEVWKKMQEAKKEKEMPPKGYVGPQRKEPDHVKVVQPPTLDMRVEADHFSPPSVEVHVKQSPPPVIPPAKQELHNVTEDDILKVAGYCEKNVRLMEIVSAQVSQCSAALAKLANTREPVNVAELMQLMQYLDNEEFRSVFSSVFQKILNRNMALLATIQDYLQGRLPASEEEDSSGSSGEQQPQGPDDMGSGTVTVTTPDGDTVQVGDSTTDSLPSGQGGETTNNETIQGSGQQNP